MRGILKNSSFFIRILSLILIFLFCSFAGAILGIAIAGVDTSSISTIRTLQLVQAVFTFVLPPFILAYLLSDKPLGYLELNHSVSFKKAALVVCFMILIIPFINLLTDLNQRIVLPEFLSGIEEALKAKELQTTEITERLLNVHTIGGLLFNIFLIAILPAVGEELFFRGTIQRILQDWKGGTLAVWVTAIIFSAAHFQFYGFIPRLLLGILLGYLFLWSKNLWIPIIAHFTNNFLVVVYYYLKNNGFTFIDLDYIGTNDTLWVGIISGVIFIAGIIFLRKFLLKQTEKKKVLLEEDFHDI